MTREEAIKWTAYVQQSEPWQDRVIEALDMAIEALKQETVSRETYDHEFNLRKEFEMKVFELEKKIAEQEGRPKGEWKKATESIWKCSLCNAIMFTDSNYCPNCGADMRKDETDES